MKIKKDGRATFNDIVHFILRQARILTDLVFGDIQDVSPAINRGLNQTTMKPISRPKGSSFATTGTSVENNNTAKDTENNSTATKGRTPANFQYYQYRSNPKKGNHAVVT